LLPPIGGVGLLRLFYLGYVQKWSEKKLSLGARGGIIMIGEIVGIALTIIILTTLVVYVGYIGIKNEFGSGDYMKNNDKKTK
jgi:hypothetical protein